jgi:mRNA interferase RelE/StbE
LAWTIRFDKTAEKQFGKLDRQAALRIRDYLRELSFLDDVRSRGKALTGNLAGLWRYRVGDLRIICDIHDKEVVVYVVELGHRKDIYD